MNSKKVLDLKNLKCPMPIIEISKFMKKMSSGEILEIYATDIVFEPDLIAWCKRTGNDLSSLEKMEGYIIATVTKRAA